VAERRSLASMFEVAMLEYVERHRISVPPADSAGQPKSKDKSASAQSPQSSLRAAGQTTGEKQ